MTHCYSAPQKVTSTLYGVRLVSFTAIAATPLNESHFCGGSFMVTVDVRVLTSIANTTHLSKLVGRNYVNIGEMWLYKCGLPSSLPKYPLQWSRVGGSANKHALMLEPT